MGACKVNVTAHRHKQVNEPARITSIIYRQGRLFYFCRHAFQRRIQQDGNEAPSKPPLT